MTGVDAGLLRDSCPSLARLFNCYLLCVGLMVRLNHWVVTDRVSSMDVLAMNPSSFRALVTITGRVQAPDFGRGVSEPLQLIRLAHTGSAGPNETIPEGTVGSDVVEMSEASNKALNRK